MSKSTLKPHIIDLAKNLKNCGFILDGYFRLKRRIQFIDQFIEIQPGSGFLEGSFTCNLCWLFTADGTFREDVYHYSVRLGALADRNDLWFSHEPKQALEESWGQFTRLLHEYALPFLDSNNDLRIIVSKYEKALANEVGLPASPSSPLYFFGKDDGWRHYNLGFAYRALADYDKSKYHINFVITQYSNFPYEWVQKRRETCEIALARLLERY